MKDSQELKFLPPVLARIVPCYNESEVIAKTNEELYRELHSMISGSLVSPESFLLYVDDGSKDDTWPQIVGFSQLGTDIHGIRLTGNRGPQNAILAGLEYVIQKCDVSITIDADLQDDIATLPKMIEEYRNGADVVCGVRKSRSTDSWFKKTSAAAFYQTMKKLGVNCVYNHADFRLLSRRAMTALLKYEERNLFLRGIVPGLGYRQANVYYDRKERAAGKTKYPLGKMMNFAIDGITSFSVRPVRMLFWLGLFFMVAATTIGVYTFIRYFTGETIEGWASLILSIWFCTGILLMGMGIMGEYIGKIYIEVKHRPRYEIMEEV